MRDKAQVHGVYFCKGLAATIGAALKVLISAEEYDSLAPEVQNFYEMASADDSNEGYVLSTDDGKFKSKISEFRSTNIKVRKEIEDLRRKVKDFEDIDPEKAREAMDRLEELEQEQMLSKGQVEELLSRRTDNMRKDYENRIKALSDVNDEIKSKYETVESRLNLRMIDDSIRDAVRDVAIPVKGAESDILSRARQMWQVREGKIVAVDDDGNERFGKDGKAQLTPKEWVTGLVEEAPFLFEGSSGGGAGGNSSGSRQSSVKSVKAEDKAAFGANLEDIATGKVKVAS